MDNNLKQILEEFEQLKGQFILTQSHTLERLVAIGTDEEDYYWVTYNGRKLTFNSCVGGVIPLKGYIREKDYNEFIRLAKLNHFDQVSFSLPKVLEDQSRVVAANIAHKNSLTKLTATDKFLTEVCWDLN